MSNIPELATNGVGGGAIFADSWLWLIFLALGLCMMILELLIGVDTGLDLVFFGSAFVVGGAATLPAHSWWLTVLVTAVICFVYVGVGRRYIHRLRQVKETKTNIDTIIGTQGIVLENINKNTFGLVRVGNEDWRAKAEEEIAEGTDIVVTGVSGVTLTVKKTTGGEQ